MISPTLLVLAAGMGSRYGGLKQLDPVGPGGETLLDYSVHDAVKSGFNRIVFLIRHDIEEEFRKKIGARYHEKVEIDYAFQQLDALPVGFAPPPGRAKPWGTAHAIWCARDVIDTPFAALNADDFYGADSFLKMGQFLAEVATSNYPAQFAMAGYRLDKTLSEHGTVARGICEVGEDGLLQGVEELTDLARAKDGSISSKKRALPPETSVSMNFWGFTPQVFPLLEKNLNKFLQAHGSSETGECYIPSAVAEMITDNQATVRVLQTHADWFGVTYREDKPRVVESVARLIEQGSYPPRL